MEAAMIHSETRTLLTDALTPPPGCGFDNGIATTFSLDLVTLLGLPLHLAWLGHARGAAEELDPIAAIEALRRTAGQLTIFCQRGRMQVPRTASPLLGLLEGMVHEVTAPHGGAFHPKVWLLKFVAQTGEVHLRFLVLSRNLTDDCSWDIALRLDGIVGRKAHGMNKPLRALLSRTIESSHKPLGATRAQAIEALMEEMMRCEWELPPHFDELKFHALGIGRKPVAWFPTAPERDWDELGVVSPFVSQDALDRLAGSCTSAPFVVSRAEEMDALPPASLQGYDTAWVMDERAESSDKEEAVPGRERGLHAKVFVGKRGWNTHLFVGSANATDAALVTGRNVEFMAELIGRASKAGRPGDWLGDDGIRPLLAPYVRTDVQDNDEDLVQQKRLEDLRCRLCAAALSLHCTADEVGWVLRLHGLDDVDMDGIAGTLWPVTVRLDGAAAMQCEPILHLGVYATQDITSFIAFKLVLGQNELCFALALPLHGAPADRDIEMLRSILRNRDGFVRYLLLLLGDLDDAAGGAEGGGNGGTWTGRGRADGLPLFEMLARTYARDPERLSHVSQVMQRLRQEGSNMEGDILPAEFVEIWKCFEDALSEEGGQ
jgi:hypothetical protein